MTANTIEALARDSLKHALHTRDHFNRDPSDRRYVDRDLGHIITDAERLLALWRQTAMRHAMPSALDHPASQRHQSLRHDAARRLVEAVDLPTVAALLRHSRLDTIRIYAQPDEAALEQAAESLGRA
ncbi:MAG: hypothetical protein JOZ81_15735 [Chloroflexi bacterium]|nr:hypothetical protein [Chloroflexota bacterium]MBV9546589.1 hypothetical protein [Chloroflexota bacterium]